MEIPLECDLSGSSMHTWKKSADHQPTTDDTRQKICMCDTMASIFQKLSHRPRFPNKPWNLEHFHDQKRMKLF